jgi:hypothetical protein
MSFDGLQRIKVYPYNIILRASSIDGNSFMMDIGIEQEMVK